MVTRYDDVREVFRNHETFSAAITLSAVTPMSPKVMQKLKESEFRMNPVLTNLDPPEHARIRKHATTAFSSRRVAAAEPWIRELIECFIDHLLTREKGPDGKRRADMVGEFAYDLPAHVGMRFVGIPDDRVPDVKAWTANWRECIGPIPTR